MKDKIIIQFKDEKYEVETERLCRADKEEHYRIVDIVASSNPQDNMAGAPQDTGLIKIPGDELRGFYIFVVVVTILIVSAAFYLKG